MGYFEIVLYDNTKIRDEDIISDRDINHIIYNDPHYLICQNKSGANYKTLLIIPHERVKAVIRKEV